MALATPNAKFSSISYCSLESNIPWVTTLYLCYLLHLISLFSGRITSALDITLVLPILVLNCRLPSSSLVYSWYQWSFKTRSFDVSALSQAQVNATRRKPQLNVYSGVCVRGLWCLLSSVSQWLYSLRTWLRIITDVHLATWTALVYSFLWLVSSTRQTLILAWLNWTLFYLCVRIHNVLDQPIPHESVPVPLGAVIIFGTHKVSVIAWWIYLLWIK
jgi:hypothetical protein